MKKIIKIITANPEYKYKRVVAISKKYRIVKNSEKSFINNIKMILLARLNNHNIFKYGIEVYGEIGEDTKIYHGSVVVNFNSKIGNNTKFHGNNCIGNNGINNICPVIGNNVDIGFGAVIIGNVKIADNITIGANSVVNKSFLEEGITIAGVPAKKIK